MMNIFFRELKANFKSLIIWSVIIALFIVVGVSKFSAYAGNPEMLKILDAFPPSVLEAFGMRAFNLTTVSGFYGIMFVYFGLMGAIAAAMWGSDIISKEERDKTVEFSLVLPVSRSRVITAKALAALVNCIVLVFVIWGVSLLAVRSYNPDQAFYDFAALQMRALFVVELIFLAIGLMLGCVLKQYRLAGSIAVGIILVTYFMSVVTVMHEKLDFLKWFTPFKYFDAYALFSSGRMDTTYLFLSAAIIVVCMAVAYLVYNRRDLYI
jgi:ABC-2 type transport system permease protein